MRLLLDTQVLLWALSGSDKLSSKMLEEMRQAELIYVSAASVWEARIKQGVGKLVVPGGFLAEVAAAGFSELAIDWEGADGIGGIDLPHKDPFDRLLVVQAKREQLRLVTADRVLLEACPDLCMDARA